MEDGEGVCELKPEYLAGDQSNWIWDCQRCKSSFSHRDIGRRHDERSGPYVRFYCPNPDCNSYMIKSSKVPEGCLGVGMIL